MASPCETRQAPLVLGFDTSAAHCAAALLSGDDLLGARAEDMTRGQAERLMPLLEELLAEHDVAWSDLARIGVGTGPGNFTGIRISVSAARGLGLGLGIPVVGVSTLEAILDSAPGACAAVPAPRGRAYLQRRGEAPALVLAETAPEALLPPPPPELAARIGRIAARTTDAPRPAPLYIRAADAAPASDPPPVILP